MLNRIVGDSAELSDIELKSYWIVWKSEVYIPSVEAAIKHSSVQVKVRA